MNNKTFQIDPKIVKRKRLRDIASVLLWCLSLYLVNIRAPVWSIIFIGLLFLYLSLLDFEVWLKVSKELRGHPDHDVQDLIDEKIDITEYRLRKERIANGSKDI